ncbi:hypothetical protein K435DRAFT_969264 [Dendrothele bispora CBS 962.96]|uniref:Guanylate cyclase domain-containing protein n=1 Tax=Dendrothele bispora (strain CBS 962.96) TaxID=1314807 RepID=A0A4S8LJF8_DENBC|nr:hypothetical protein K435DRAFT_969264 [Dendrothele bispora CBS 962.96]
MVDRDRKVSPTTVVPQRPSRIVIPRCPDGPHSQSGGGSPWVAPESWKVQPEVETSPGNSSSEEDFFSRSPRTLKWTPKGPIMNHYQTSEFTISHDGSETCVSTVGTDESGGQHSLYSFPRKGSDTRSIQTVKSALPRLPKAAPQLKSLTLKIFRHDNSFHVVDSGVQVTVAGLTEKLGAKLLAKNEKIHKLYLVEKGRERMLTPSERPVDIVRRRLDMAGYDMKDGSQLLGPDGLSFLLKFVYKSQQLDSTPLDIDHFERVDLSGRSLRTIPIVLHKHSDQIVSLYLSGNPIPLDFIQSYCYGNDTTLSRLDVSSNSINDLEKLPWHFPRLKSLVSLNLSSNKFETVPIVVCELVVSGSLNVAAELLECDDGKPVFHPHDKHVIARGISVRMGIHCGSRLCKRDPLNHRMDYFGPAVNRAARISGHANGGQICVAQMSLREIHARVLNDGPPTPYSEYQPSEAIEAIRQIGISHFVGEVNLEGLELPEMVSVIYPAALAHRHAIQDYLAAPPDWTSSRVQFNVTQIRQLGMVYLRLEALASSRIIRENFERIHAAAAAHADQDEEETQLYLYGDPNVLLPALNDNSSDREMSLALDALSARIENVTAKLKEMSRNSSL